MGLSSKFWPFPEWPLIFRHLSNSRRWWLEWLFYFDLFFCQMTQFWCPPHQGLEQLDFVQVWPVSWIFRSYVEPWPEKKWFHVTFHDFTKFLMQSYQSVTHGLMAISFSSLKIHRIFIWKKTFYHKFTNPLCFSYIWQVSELSKNNISRTNVKAQFLAEGFLNSYLEFFGLVFRDDHRISNIFT